MRIKAMPVKSEDVKPGDLFSTADQFYWDHYDPKSIGEKVYIRTEAPCPECDIGFVVHKIEIEKEKGED